MTIGTCVIQHSRRSFAQRAREYTALNAVGSMTLFAALPPYRSESRYSCINAVEYMIGSMEWLFGLVGTSSSSSAAVWSVDDTNRPKGGE